MENGFPHVTLSAVKEAGLRASVFVKLMAEVMSLSVSDPVLSVSDSVSSKVGLEYLSNGPNWR